jgi:hypothetical protein
MMRGSSRNTDPMSSHQACDVVQVSDLEAKVLAALKQFKAGATSHELARRLRRQLVSVSPRLRPLANRRLIKDSGERRKGQSGVRQIVWELAP